MQSPKEIISNKWAQFSQQNKLQCPRVEIFSLNLPSIVKKKNAALVRNDSRIELQSNVQA